MINLDSTTKKLEIETDDAGSVDFYISYADIDTGAGSIVPGSSSGNITSATTTDLIAAPSLGVVRQIKYISIKNKDAAQQTIIIKLDNSGTDRYLTPPIILREGESVNYTSKSGWISYDSNGLTKVNSNDREAPELISSAFLKPVGTGSEAGGRWHCYSKDAGLPGVWATGSPGLEGRATDGRTTADDGCVSINNSGTRSNHITSFCAAQPVTHGPFLIDILWVNTGIAVTTTTAQTINSVAFPDRDLNGATSGAGIWVGLLVTATMGNAIITNTTMSYTNSAGTAGKTATISSWPATAVIGTIVWFELAAGDSGVRSIQSITLGTTYVSGSFSLIAARIITGGTSVFNGTNLLYGRSTRGRGIRIYDGSCLHLAYIAGSALASSIYGHIGVAKY